MPPQSASRTEEGQQPLSAAEPQQCTEPSESAAAASRQSRSAQLTPSVAQQLSKLGVQRILTTDVRIASLRAGIPVPAPPRPPNPLPLLQSPPIHSIFPLRGLGLGNRFYFALNTAGGGAVVDPCGQLYIPIQPTSSNSPQAVVRVIAACVHPTLPLVAYATNTGHVHQYCCMPMSSRLIQQLELFPSFSQSAVVPPGVVTFFRMSKIPDGYGFTQIAFNSTGDTVFLGGELRNKGVTSMASEKSSSSCLSIYWFNSVLVTGPKPRVTMLNLTQWDSITHILPCPSPELNTLVLLLGREHTPNDEISSRVHLLNVNDPRSTAAFRGVYEIHPESVVLTTAAWSPDGSLIAIGDSNGIVSVWAFKAATPFEDYIIQDVFKSIAVAREGGPPLQYNECVYRASARLRRQAEQYAPEGELAVEAHMNRMQQERTARVLIPVMQFRAQGPIHSIAIACCREDGSAQRMISGGRYLVAYSAHITSTVLTVRNVSTVGLPGRYAGESVVSMLQNEMQRVGEPLDDTVTAHDKGRDGSGAILLMTHNGPKLGSERSTMSTKETLAALRNTAAADGFEADFAKGRLSSSRIAIKDQPSPPQPQPEEQGWPVGLQWVGSVLSVAYRYNIVRLFAQDSSEYNKLTQPADEFKFTITPEIASQMTHYNDPQQPFVCTGPSSSEQLPLPKFSPELILVAMKRIGNQPDVKETNPQDARQLSLYMGSSDLAVGQEALSECSSVVGPVTCMASRPYPLTVVAGNECGSVDCWCAEPA